MDQDGANVAHLTNGNDLVLTPRFSPTAQEITYMSFAGQQPRVYLLQLETGQREVVGNFPGMTFAPRFSPDGQKRHHEPAAGRQRQHLHDGPALAHDDAPDQRRRRSTRRRPIRRTARRSSSNPTAAARQQLYVMSADGSGQHAHLLRRRPLLDAGLVAARRLIAFTKQSGGKFCDRRDEAGRFGRAHPDRRASTMKARPGRRTAGC